MSPVCGIFFIFISRLLYGELPYWATVLVAYLGGTVLVAAMTSLSSFATLKTLYILWFDRVNDVPDATIVKIIQGLTVLLTIIMVSTEGLVRVSKLDGVGPIDNRPSTEVGVGVGALLITT